MQNKIGVWFFIKIQNSRKSHLLVMSVNSPRCRAMAAQSLFISPKSQAKIVFKVPAKQLNCPTTARGPQGGESRWHAHYLTTSIFSAQFSSLFSVTFYILLYYIRGEVYDFVATKWLQLPGVRKSRASIWPVRAEFMLKVFVRFPIGKHLLVRHWNWVNEW